MNNWKLRHSFTGNATSDVQTVNGYLASGEDNDFAVTVVPDGKEYAAPLFIPRTNLLLQSNQFDTTWTTGNATVTGGQAGYDATSDAWKVDITNAGGSVRQIVSFSGVVTTSLYVKAGTLGFVRLLLLASPNRLIDVNLSTGAITEYGTIISHNSEDVGGGWFRISFTADVTSGGGFYVYPAIAINDFTATSGNIYIQDAQLEAGTVATEYIPTTTAAVTRDWSAFGRVQNQLPGICNGTHTHTGAASGSGIAATTITGSGSGATFAYDFDTLGVLTTLTADGAGSGYKVGDKLSIDTTEGHTIEFRLVDGSNAATVSVSMDATRPNKPIPFPVSKMRVEGLSDRTVLFLDRRSQYVFPKPTPYLLDTYEGAAAAYSLRRLRSAYTGPAVRVRRETNNDELDIYFNADGSLDTATLEAFCAGTNGFVSVWYDQGQGGNNATQTTTANQPTIVSSGSVVTKNGKPAILSALNSRMNLTQFTATTTFGVYQMDDDAPAALSYLLYHSANVTGLYTGGSLASGIGVFDGAFKDIAQGKDTDPHLGVWYYNGTNYELAVDGNTFASVLAGSSISVDGIGRITGAQLSIVGGIHEIVGYSSDQSANRTGIEDNINAHYGIYP